MIFMSGIMRIIIQKNTLCTNNISVINFCPNCVKFLPKNGLFFIFLGATAPLKARALMPTIVTDVVSEIKRKKGLLPREKPMGIKWRPLKQR